MWNLFTGGYNGRCTKLVFALLCQIKLHVPPSAKSNMQNVLKIEQNRDTHAVYN